MFNIFIESFILIKSPTLGIDSYGHLFSSKLILIENLFKPLLYEDIQWIQSAITIDIQFESNFNLLIELSLNCLFLMQSVAKDLFKDLTIDGLIDLKTNTKILFQTSLKIFYISFCCYQWMSEELKQLFDHFFDEYKELMRNVFEMKDTNEEVMSDLERDLFSERIKLTFGIIKARNMDTDSGERPKINVWTNISSDKTNHFIQLDDTEEVQKQASIEVDIGFKEFIELKIFDKLCEITVTVNQKTARVVIPYREINAEGFTDWRYFNGLEALVRISIQMIGKTSSEAQSIHMTSIAYVIRYRLSQLLDTTKVDQLMAKWHKSVSFRRNVEPLQKLIAPESRLSFWAKPPTDEKSVKLLRADLTFGRKCHFHDLNVDLFTDLFEDNPYCVCSEWCNWGAFYYHNPILRWFITQHNHLYIKNHCLIPALYVAIVCNEMSLLSVDDNRLKLLFRLMTSSFDYYEKRINKILKSFDY